MQFGTAEFLRLEADFLLVQMQPRIFARPVFQVVAKRRITGGVMHVARVVGA